MSNYTVMVVGYVDTLGYLYCRKCADPIAADPTGEHYVWNDSYPHTVEACDSCGERLVRRVPVRDIREGDNVITAGSAWTVDDNPTYFDGYVTLSLDAGYGKRGRYHFRDNTFIAVVPTRGQ